MKIILAILVLINFSNICYAGDIVKSGEVLEEDSYVFSIDEANKLMQRVKELEKAELKLEEYKKLDELYNSKINYYIENESIYKRRVENLNEIIDSLEEINSRNNKRKKWDKVENYVIFSSAVAATILTFISVDYINDNFIDE